jgi:hypothetical protein
MTLLNTRRGYGLTFRMERRSDTLGSSRSEEPRIPAFRNPARPPHVPRRGTFVAPYFQEGWIFVVASSVTAEFYCLGYYGYNSNVRHPIDRIC